MFMLLFWGGGEIIDLIACSPTRRRGSPRGLDAPVVIIVSVIVVISISSIVSSITVIIIMIIMIIAIISNYAA